MPARREGKTEAAASGDWRWWGISDVSRRLACVFLSSTRGAAQTELSLIGAFALSLFCSGWSQLAEPAIRATRVFLSVNRQLSSAERPSMLGLRIAPDLPSSSISNNPHSVAVAVPPAPPHPPCPYNLFGWPPGGPCLETPGCIGTTTPRANGTHLQVDRGARRPRLHGGRYVPPREKPGFGHPQPRQAQGVGRRGSRHANEVFFESPAAAAAAAGEPPLLHGQIFLVFVFVSPGRELWTREGRVNSQLCWG